MKKETDVFDKLDNVLGNYDEGFATEKDVIKTAKLVNAYVFDRPHPDDIIRRFFTLTLAECLREEFLINTQNYPKEYHDLFFKKYKRAEDRYLSQINRNL